MFTDLESGAPKTLSTAELQRDLLARRLQVLQEHPVALSKQAEAATRLVQTIEDLPKSEQLGLQRRIAFVKHMLRLGIGKGMRARIQAEIRKWSLPAVTEVAVDGSQRDEPPPSASAVMGWMRRYERSGGNPLSLISGYRFRQPRRRLPPLVWEVAERKVRDFYCTRKRPSAKETKRVIDQELAQHAARGRLDEDQSQITYATLRRVIQEISPYDRDVARYGPSYARSRWRYSLHGVNASRVLARYEIDHTVLDIVAVDDRNGLPLGRPTITVVVDSYSGYITGFWISFWSASLASALSAFKVAIRPKDC